MKEKYKFRLCLDETWSFGVLGRTGRGLTEAQNVDAAQVDMIIGSLSGPLCAAGGFCAGTRDVVSHQRINAASYTFSAALPAMAAVTSSETLNLLQSNPEILLQCRDNIKAMWAQIDPRSDWVRCTSHPENPIMLLSFKPDVVEARQLTYEEQERLMQECAEEVSFPFKIVIPSDNRDAVVDKPNTDTCQRRVCNQTEEHASGEQHERDSTS